MTDKTLEFIHDAYNRAAQMSRDILSIINNFYNLLNDYTPDDVDSKEYDMLLRNVDSSRKHRANTFQTTNFIIDISFVIMHIGLWLNQTQNADIDVNITGRRKSLESELCKMLIKQNIHDLFGMRAIILNNFSPEDSKEKLFLFSEMVIGIITKSNRRAFRDFYCWVENNSEDNISKERIKNILDLPFKIIVAKDYVNNPKSNDYQSLQYVLAVESYSSSHPGAEFELQLRTNYMHQVNENGSASHSDYKSDRNIMKKIFSIDDFSKINIVGFSSYNSVEDDIDGIHFAKMLINRRISNSLVPF